MNVEAFDRRISQMQTTLENRTVTIPPEVARIRSFGPADAEPVADLLARVFQKSRRPAPAGMAAYLRKVFVEAPYCDAEITSRVLQQPDGRIAGFIGVLPLPMIAGGRQIRGAVATSFAVDFPAADPLAGARLMRSFLAGPQDISLADRANEASTAMWTSQRGTAMREYSFEWLRVIRPAGYAMELLAGRVKAVRLAAPLARAIDAVAARSSKPESRGGKRRGDYAVAPIDNERLLELLPLLMTRYSLRPNWTRDALRSLLDDAAKKADYGTLTSRVVTFAGEPIGAFLYHSRRGGVARVLQMLAQPRHEEAVVGRLLADADEAEAVAIRGRAQPWAIDTLLAHRCTLSLETSALVNCRDPELLQYFSDGTAFFNGLAGEYWMRLNGDRFD